MFSTLGLFRKLPCPQLDACTRQNCLYSHSPGARASSLVSQQQPAVFSANVQSTLTTVQSQPVETVPAKRPAILKSSSVSTEPPRKLQKVGPSQRPLATIPSTSTITQHHPSDTSRTEVCGIEVMVLSTKWLLFIFSLAFQSSGLMLLNPWFHFLFDKYVLGSQANALIGKHFFADHAQDSS